MNNPLVSIIVPTYNGEKYISRCLDSLVNQTYKNIEIIVVDDGSSDNTPNILKEYSKKYSNIKIIKQKNSGVSSARNNAISIASGVFLQFTDSDDWIENNMIELMVKSSIEKKSDIVISEYKNYYEKDDSFEAIKLKDYDMTFKELISDENTLYGGFPWNKLIKKECISKIYDENVHYYENLLFFLENSVNLKKYSVVHKPLYIYNINENSAVHTKKYNVKKVSMLDALLRIIQIVDDEYKDFYKYMYVSKFHENYVYIKALNLDITLLNKYIEKNKLFEKELNKKNNLNKRLKLKFFLITKLTVIYNFIKIFKLRK